MDKLKTVLNEENVSSVKIGLKGLNTFKNKVVFMNIPDSKELMNLSGIVIKNNFEYLSPAFKCLWLISGK